MLSVFVDESLNRDQWWITAIVVPSGAVDELAAAIHMARDVAKSEHPSLAEVAERHGADMFHGRGPWRSLALRERIRLYGHVLDVIADAPVSVICKGVVRSSLATRYARPFHPHRAVMACVLIDVAEKFCASDSYCSARIYADRHDETYKVIGRDLSAAQRGDNDAWHRVDLRRISGDIGWVDSRNSPIVQAADVIGFLNLRLRHTEKTSAIARENRRLWRKVAQRRHVHTYLWDPGR